MAPELLRVAPAKQYEGRKVDLTKGGMWNCEFRSTHQLVDHADHTLEIIFSTENDALRAILLDYKAFRL